MGTRPVHDFIAALPVCFVYYVVYVGNQIVSTEFVESAKLHQYTDNKTGQAFAEAAEAASADASTIMALYWTCLEIPSLLATVFLGPYSDLKGRKMAMIMPNITILLLAVFSIMIWSTGLTPEWLYIACFCCGWFGNNSLFLGGINAYVADIADPVVLSKWMALFGISITVGMGVSAIAVGLIVEFFGFLWSFFSVGLLALMNIIYIVFWMKETVTKREGKLFTMEHIHRLYRIFFIDTATKRRWKLQTIFVINFLYCAIEFGMSSVMVLFLLAPPYFFNPVEIGLFLATKRLSSILCILILTGTSSDKKPINAHKLIVWGLVSFLLFNLWFLIPWPPGYSDLIFIGPVLAMLTTFPHAMLISLCSLNCSDKDQGAALTGLSFGDELAAFAGFVVFGFVYTWTVDLYNAAIFVISSIMIFTALILGMYLWKETARQEKVLLNITEESPIIQTSKDSIENSDSDYGSHH